MPFTEKDLKKIRSILPKNLRQKIVSKCAEMGDDITVRQVSLVLENKCKNHKMILAVTNAISDLIKEETDAMAVIEDKISKAIH